MMEQNSVMQTWLPYPDFQESAHALDLATLGIQREHVLAVLDVLHDSSTSIFHGAPDRLVNMWRGHEPQLCEYGLVIAEEYQRRMATDNKILNDLDWHLDCATSGEFSMDKPKWFGDIDFHNAHKSALLRTNPAFYRDKFDVSRTLEMIWPEA